MVEVIHAIDESALLIKQLLNSDLKKVITQDYVAKAGEASVAVEAPRGTLYYHVDIDDKGYIKNVNIITPTAQCLANLEDDIAQYLPRVVKLENKKREKKLRAFIRAYDPCISCAVH